MSLIKQATRNDGHLPGNIFAHWGGRVSGRGGQNDHQPHRHFDRVHQRDKPVTAHNGHADGSFDLMFDFIIRT